MSTLETAENSAVFQFRRSATTLGRHKHNTLLVGSMLREPPATVRTPVLVIQLCVKPLRYAFLNEHHTSDLQYLGVGTPSLDMPLRHRQPNVLAPLGQMICKP
jgi:hypothetical protein